MAAATSPERVVPEAEESAPAPVDGEITTEFSVEDSDLLEALTDGGRPDEREVIESERTARGMGPARLGDFDLGDVGDTSAPSITSYEEEPRESFTMGLGSEPSTARLEAVEEVEEFDPVNDPPSIEIPADLSMSGISEASVDEWEALAQTVDPQIFDTAEWERAGSSDRVSAPSPASEPRAPRQVAGRAETPTPIQGDVAAHAIRPRPADDRNRRKTLPEFDLHTPTLQAVPTADALSPSEGDDVEDTSTGEIWRRLPSTAIPTPTILAERQVPGAVEFRQSLVLRTPHEYVYGVAISRDAKQIATCGGDNSVCIWSRGGDLLHRFRIDDDGLNSVAFSFDGRALVAGGDDQLVHLWLLPPEGSSAPVRHAPMEGHNGWISSVAFSDEGSFVLTGSYDGTAKVWKLQNGKCVRTLEGHEGPVSGVALGLGRALTVGHDGTMRVWNQKWAQVDLIGGHDRLLSVSSTGPVTALTASNGDVFVVRDGRETALLKHRGQARGVHVRGDGCIFTCGEDGQIRVYTAGSEDPNQLLVTGTKTWCIDASRDLAAVGADNGNVYVFTEAEK